MTPVEKAHEFVYRNARSLDLTRWQFHFEDGARESVMRALAVYQNADGGFGHALEADAWNPNSAPIQVWAATEILREIDWTDSGHPVVTGILRYLASGQDFDGHFWFNAVRSNNDYPHAPWWHVVNQSEPEDDYNPTACLASFIIRFANRESAVYQLGRRVAQEAIDAYLAQGLLDAMHTVQCYVRLLEDAEIAGDAGLDSLDALKEKLRLQVRTSITQDTAAWQTAYICKPSLFFNSRENVFYADNQAIADYECDYIERTQAEDGLWDITWSWGAYPEEWAVSKNWWKSGLAISNLLYLKGMGRL
ncbi:MAG: hypothetical protein U0452_12645 [Anaerolineae bacterium]